TCFGGGTTALSTLAFVFRPSSLSRCPVQSGETLPSIANQKTDCRAATSKLAVQTDPLSFINYPLSLPPTLHSGLGVAAETLGCLIAPALHRRTPECHCCPRTHWRSCRLSFNCNRGIEWRRRQDRAGRGRRPGRPPR